MTRADRDRAVQAALDWLIEDGLTPTGELAKFPGWAWDEKVARAVLDSSLVVYPRLALIPALAALRMHWVPAGPASAKAWYARWRNWLRLGAQKWGDPLVGASAGARATANGPPIADSRPTTDDRGRPTAVGGQGVVGRQSEAAPVPLSEVARAEIARIKRMGGRDDE